MINPADKNAGANNSIQTILNQSDNVGNNEIVISATRSLLSGLTGAIFGQGTNWFYGTNDHSLNNYYLINYSWINFSSFNTNGNTKICWNNIENSPYNALSSTNPSALGNGKLDIGKEASNFPPYHFNGKMKEIILYKINNGNILNGNINNYYALY